MATYINYGEGEDLAEVKSPDLKMSGRCHCTGRRVVAASSSMLDAHIALYIYIYYAHKHYTIICF